MTTGLTTVHLVGVPVQLWYRTRVWFEGLVREFDILATDQGESTPRELLEFVGEARERFGQFTSESNAALEEAYRRGEESIDVQLELPPEAAPVARELWGQIEQAVQYCRHGDLLTLTPDAELLRYVRWYIHQIAGQLEGEPPQPWDQPTR